MLPDYNGSSINKKGPYYRALRTLLDVTGDQIGRCERIRTSDPFLPKEVRYQAAPHTDALRRATIPKQYSVTNGSDALVDSSPAGQ